MVSNEIVLQTVKKMISTGVDDATIKQTLSGIGISDGEIESIILSAKGISKEQEKKAVEAVDNAEQDDADSEEAMGESEEDLGEDYESVPEPSARRQFENVSQEQAAQHATTHNALEEHSEKIYSMHQKIDDLHSKFDSTPKLSPETLAKINSIDLRLTELSKDVGETKANTMALQDLLKKILETNRKTLLEMQKKK